MTTGADAPRQVSKTPPPGFGSPAAQAKTPPTSIQLVAESLANGHNKGMLIVQIVFVHGCVDDASFGKQTGFWLVAWQLHVNMYAGHYTVCLKTYPCAFCKRTSCLCHAGHGIQLVVPVATHDMMQKCVGILLNTADINRSTKESNLILLCFCMRSVRLWEHGKLITDKRYWFCSSSC